MSVGKVQLARLPDDGVPNAGVTSVGEVANTRAPEPVSSVTAEAKLALEGVAKKVATPVPKPEIPVATGSPVQLVSVPEAGVPNTGAVRVGLVRVLFVSVSVVARPTKVSVEVGSVSVPVLLMVLMTGVTSVGEVASTSAPEPVSSVTAEAKLALEGVAKKVATPVPKPEIPEIGRAHV